MKYFIFVGVPARFSRDIQTKKTDKDMAFCDINHNKNQSLLYIMDHISLPELG
jgi:hypothetical protein